MHYVYGITEFRENEPSVQKSVFNRLRVEHCSGLQQRLSDFLLYQHITPHTTTGRPPADLLMGRKLRSKLDLLIPDVSAAVSRTSEEVS